MRCGLFATLVSEDNKKREPTGQRRWKQHRTRGFGARPMKKFNWPISTAFCASETRVVFAFLRGPVQARKLSRAARSS